MTPGKKRQAEYRARMLAEGRRQYSFWLTDEQAKAIKTYLGGEQSRLTDRLPEPKAEPEPPRPEPTRRRGYARIHTPHRKRNWYLPQEVTLCPSRQVALKGPGLAALVEGPIDLVVGGPRYVVDEWLYAVPQRLWALTRRRDDDDSLPLPVGPGQWVIKHYRTSLSYGVTWREGDEWRAVLYPALAERIPPGEWRGTSRAEAVERLWSACLASGDMAFAWARKLGSESPADNEAIPKPEPSPAPPARTSPKLRLVKVQPSKPDRRSESEVWMGDTQIGRVWQTGHRTWKGFPSGFNERMYSAPTQKAIVERIRRYKDDA